MESLKRYTFRFPLTTVPDRRYWRNNPLSTDDYGLRYKGEIRRKRKTNLDSGYNFDVLDRRADLPSCQAAEADSEAWEMTSKPQS